MTLGENALDTNKTILLAEDDIGHATLVRRWLKRNGVDYRVVHVEDGQYAVDYLLRQGSYANHDDPLPSVLLLDLNMPRLTGLQVMERMMIEADLSTIPVIVLTTSDEAEDMRWAKSYGYVDYCVKPPDYDKLAQQIQSLMRESTAQSM